MINIRFTMHRLQYGISLPLHLGAVPLSGHTKWTAEEKKRPIITSWIIDN